MTPLEILEAHQIGGFKSDGHNRVVICSGCQKRLTGQGQRLDDIIRAHVAQVLDEAMREAKAMALEDFAKVIDAEERDQWIADGIHRPGAQIVAQRMKILGKVARTRAEQYKTNHG
ncbi:hypothetical protein NMP99_02965 [Glutamicibacter mishrai]|uniref:hypothetical protein n=1 Tax=Glutamicibacter mishrai TaxID=1775880 RepID=UPI0020CEA4E4|nr:hypothetical protein [Glutamicibacter mishrai]UTT40236.1 hypothetical protein NMP99_02675 [Glutamicibacter mishrai]UTT40287.1 hypothetical protein NMP99_02965 [Glutamicibacter mishrai]